jgi:uncharacterized repeat protein (TIGR04076 family)
MSMVQYKITVLKRTFDRDLVEQYIQEGQRRNHGLCDVFREGQEFITDLSTGIPPGFCPWAWDDIQKSLVALAAHDDAPTPYQDQNIVIACCTDGTRPVVFRIERIATMVR